MNNKILVLVYVPSFEASFEFYIPINKKIGTIKNSLKDFIEKEYGCSIKESGVVSIIDKETGLILNEDIFVYDSIIRNGTKILLI